MTKPRGRKIQSNCKPRGYQFEIQWLETSRAWAVVDMSDGGTGRILHECYFLHHARNLAFCEQDRADSEDALLVELDTVHKGRMVERVEYNTQRIAEIRECTKQSEYMSAYERDRVR